MSIKTKLARELWGKITLSSHCWIANQDVRTSASEGISFLKVALRLLSVVRVFLRACFKIPWGPVFAEKAEWRGATKENIPGGSSTEEQRSQAAFSAKTLRAAGLLSAAGVGSALTARCGDAPASPPWPQSKSLAAGPHAILKQALRRRMVNERTSFGICSDLQLLHSFLGAHVVLFDRHDTLLLHRAQKLSRGQP